MKKGVFVLSAVIFLRVLNFAQTPASIPELLSKLNSGNDSVRVELFNHIAFLYFSKDRFDSAIYYTKTALTLCEKRNDQKRIGDAYNNLGTIYRMYGDNEKAMENLVKALRIFEKNNYYKQTAKALGNISSIYAKQNKYNEAIKTLIQAVQKSEMAKDTLTLIDLYTTIGEDYQHLKQPAEARNFIRRGEALATALLKRPFLEPMDSVKFIYARSFLNKVSASIYAEEGNFNAAIALLKKELADSKMYNVAGINKIEICTQLGDNYFRTGRFDSALVFTDLALEHLKTDSLPESYRNIYGLRAKIFSRTNRFEEAYQSHILFKSLSDSISTENIVKNISEIQTKYETEKKDQQILLLNKEKKTQRIISALAIGAVIIALGLLAFALRSRKLQQKLFRQKEELLTKEKEVERKALEQKMTELEQMALRAQMNPHFIFNSLNSVQHFVMNKDVEGVNKYLGAFAHLIRQTLNNSGKQLVSLDEEIKYLDTYLSLEKMKSNNRFSYSITTDPGIDTGNTLIPGMILQPFVENSIKHGVAHKINNDGFINIRISKNGKLVCRIDDNGIGRQKAGEIKTAANPEYESKGMDITLRRIETINKMYNTSVSVQVADLLDAAGKASGTSVTVELPPDME